MFVGDVHFIFGDNYRIQGILVRVLGRTVYNLVTVVSQPATLVEE
jgi:hypothetical protein